MGQFATSPPREARPPIPGQRRDRRPRPSRVRSQHSRPSSWRSRAQRGVSNDVRNQLTRDGRS